MIVSIHQPQFFPWLGYIDKIIQSDVFCYLDNVQYKKNEWQNRNRIKTVNGSQWLTVPVRYKYPQKINEVKINNQVNWKRKHIQGLITNYKKAPFFNSYFEVFEQIYEKDWDLISELNIYIIERMIEVLGIKGKKTIRSSELDLCDDPTDRLIDICEAVGGTSYLSGEDGASYVNMERFEKRRIHLSFQRFDHPKYPQLFGEFTSHLSIIDLIFNCGPESLRIIRSLK